ncbi:hypothetical protein H7J07_05845 [Mycobacterium koreense]|uniref:Uncharacterized protein n=1 Tax=Mycolicibacillus koreensis TaxID=1069220 RepID=A0A7I7SB69_9MYCO|nr:hypothetical protein [Mycolicibacillus koreensis]MCV7247748.1 hypothetical protein [Mycolicibacillus koreensis]OSC34727.1 hypothetical protein B8W67_05620 [Mycolicibacillus koreensis]BBY54132.1 hypothetical protein MKOR_13830 [Mycolicibacillus koreensis]
MDSARRGRDNFRRSASQEGIIGPRGARGTTKDELDSAYPNRHQFRLYDDDGELYYTGTLFWVGGDAPAEHQAYGPLGDFGMPGSGCTMLTSSPP